MLYLAIFLGLTGFGLFVWSVLELREAPGIEKHLLGLMLLSVLLMALGFYQAYAALVALA